MDNLASIINAAEDEIFADFCANVGLANIREYEERQLKVAQEESEVRLKYDTQIARLTHQYVLFCVLSQFLLIILLDPILKKNN